MPSFWREPVGGFTTYPFTSVFMLASDDGITTVLACKLSLKKKKTWWVIVSGTLSHPGCGQQNGGMGSRGRALRAT